MTNPIDRIRRTRPVSVLIACALAFGLAAGGSAFAMGSSGGGGGMVVPDIDRSSREPKTPQKPTETRNYLKAVELINEGKYEDAIGKLKKVERDAPNDPDVLNYLGYANRKLGKNEDSLAYYHARAASRPEPQGRERVSGRALSADGRPAEGRGPARQARHAVQLRLRRASGAQSRDRRLQGQARRDRMTEQKPGAS